MNYYLKIIIHLRLFYHFNTNKKCRFSSALFILPLQLLHYYFQDAPSELPLAAPLKSSHNKVPDITQIFDIHFLKTASESLFSKVVLPLLRIPFSFIIHSFLTFLLHLEHLINFAIFIRSAIWIYISFRMRAIPQLFNKHFFLFLCHHIGTCTVIVLEIQLDFIKE